MLLLTNWTCCLWKNSKLIPKRIRSNEWSLSDIWGACIEYYAAPGKSTWLIGDIERKSGSLVTFGEPKSEGTQIQMETNRMWYYHHKWLLGTHKQRCLKPLVLHSDDREVRNKWHWKLYNVTGINIDKAAKIAYRLECLFVC
jgi:hypothetical protein